MLKMKLKWQDVVLTIISLAFCYALIPQIIYNYNLHVVNISWQTLIITMLGLYFAGFCYFTLKLYFTAISTSISATCWLIILIQKIIF